MPNAPSTRMVLLCHGSSTPSWCEPFEALARELKQKHGDERVFLAYLEKSEPQLATLMAELAATGPGTIQILPMFLSAGRHLREDVPKQVDGLGLRYPGLKIELLQPVGTHPAFGRLVMELVDERL